ncbi:lipoyl protein ligase domain-containing protein [Vulcanococcus limneticus]|uniref:lipoyl protein ligase domain-containing protein n=1 Tax=Vulcanococcus limneticus TaxID=2170428 RepID=UPI001E39C2F7|nr:lipoate--protein ligase family protein [Vulcanococcus limneticus]
MTAPWRWIPLLEADGALQMALDDWLLDQALAGGPPVLRLYGWSRPTLSLGFHQRRLESHWPSLAAAGRLALVRRPSGGRAVLHEPEQAGLTYALVQRPAQANRPRAYADSCRWLQRAFRELGQPLAMGRAAARAEAPLQRASCFATSTAADLVHANGAKRIGSAQLWRQGTLLQHGSLLLAPSETLWREVFGEAPTPLPPLGLGGHELMTLLRRCAEQDLCAGGLQEQPLGGEEWAAVQARAERYRWPAAGASLVSSAPEATSPLATMARAT